MPASRPLRVALAVSLIAVVFAACVPAASTETLPAELTTTTPGPLPGETDAPIVSTPPVAATSRGPDLVASDPASVAFGTGRPALVEFFRFT